MLFSSFIPSLMKMTVKSSIISARRVTKTERDKYGMVRYSHKELNEKFSDEQDAEIERLLAKGTVPDDQLDLIRYS